MIVGFRLLRRANWWRWVAIPYAFVTIVWPTAAYALAHH